MTCRAALSPQTGMHFVSHMEMISVPWLSVWQITSTSEWRVIYPQGQWGASTVTNLWSPETLKSCRISRKPYRREKGSYWRQRQLERINQNKPAGPEGVSHRVLQTCAEQLCWIRQHLFNLSLSQEKVPELWKTSCLVPVPTKSHASALSDYRHWVSIWCVICPDITNHESPAEAVKAFVQQVHIFSDDIVKVQHPTKKKITHRKLVRWE